MTDRLVRGLPCGVWQSEQLTSNPLGCFNLRLSSWESLEAAITLRSGTHRTERA